MCEEKQRLLELCERLELAIERNITALNQRAGTVSPNEHAALRHGVRIGREEAKRARLALDEHVSEHGC